jgi:uncharacterized protein YcfJ
MKRIRSIAAQSAVAMLAGVAAVGAFAQSPYAPASPPPGPEYGRVLSSTPIQTQVSVPRQVCGVEQVVSPAQKSGGGAVLGAIAGGVVGNAVGHGSGRAAATAVGIVGGALLGDRLEGGSPAQVQHVERCVTQHVMEYRTTGYNVMYEYAGRQYNVQMPQDPGQWIKLQITPVGGPQSVAPVYAPQATVVGGSVIQEQLVYASPVVYAAPAVYASPVVVSPSLVFGATYVSGGHHRPYRHHHVQPSVGVRMTYGQPGHSRSWY